MLREILSTFQRRGFTEVNVALKVFCENPDGTSNPPEHQKFNKMVST